MERNHVIDLLKFTCAILVVFLHTKSAYHDALTPITRCAVPCFFMISGYLLFNGYNIGKERLKKNTINILKLTIWSTLLFAIVREFLSLKDGVLYLPTSKQWSDFLLFNQNPFVFHLWYLSAYLYVLLIVSIFDKYNKWQILFYFIPVLLLGDLILGKYSLVLLNKEFPYVWVRNFLFVGLPYFSLGAWIKKTTRGTQY